MNMIEGVPEGWEVVRWGQAEPGDWCCGFNGGVHQYTGTCVSFGRALIVRKIEKPKRYRPFANAAEFKPHRDRWTYHPKYPDKMFRETAYNDDGIFDGRSKHTYVELFEAGTLFEDGTPFGIEVTDDAD